MLKIKVDFRALIAFLILFFDLDSQMEEDENFQSVLDGSQVTRPRKRPSFFRASFFVLLLHDNPTPQCVVLSLRHFRSVWLQQQSLEASSGVQKLSVRVISRSGYFLKNYR
jgi:hypothetical protein